MTKGNTVPTTSGSGRSAARLRRCLTRQRNERGSSERAYAPDLSRRCSPERIEGAGVGSRRGGAITGNGQPPVPASPNPGPYRPRNALFGRWWRTNSHNCRTNVLRSPLNGFILAERCPARARITSAFRRCWTADRRCPLVIGQVWNAAENCRKPPSKNPHMGAFYGQKKGRPHLRADPGRFPPPVSVH